MTNDVDKDELLQMLTVFRLMRPSNRSQSVFWKIEFDANVID